MSTYDLGMRNETPNWIKQLGEKIGHQLHKFWEMRAERRAIADLRRLDDRMLRDMGISRSEIRAAVRGEIYRR